MALNFPTSPTLNQLHTVGSKTWKWNGYAWDLQVQVSGTIDSASVTAAWNTANNSYNQANNAYNQANSALSLAQAAYDQANTGGGGGSNSSFDQNLNTSNSVSFAELTVTGNTNVQHIIPSANLVYDIGSPSNRFRDLYLSGNTMYLGAASLTVSESGNALNLPQGSTVNNEPLLSGGFDFGTINVIINSPIDLFLYQLDLNMGTFVSPEPLELDLGTI